MKKPIDTYDVTKYSSLDGSTKVKIEKNEDFHLTASSSGISIYIKKDIESHDEWMNFSKDLGKMADIAQQHWSKLRRTISTNLSGHE